jgi:hypothetical protein
VWTSNETEVNVPAGGVGVQSVVVQYHACHFAFRIICVTAVFEGRFYKVNNGPAKPWKRVKLGVGGRIFTF